MISGCFRYYGFTGHAGRSLRCLDAVVRDELQQNEQFFKIYTPKDDSFN